MKVSLEQLVAIPNTRPLWPAEFNSLMTIIDENPNDKTAWGVAADWLSEPERDEQDLAEAFRWVHKRDEVKIEAATESYYQGLWRFVDKTMPAGVRDSVSGYAGSDEVKAVDCHTLAGLAAKLAAGLRHLKKQMF